MTVSPRRSLFAYLPIGLLAVVLAFVALTTPPAAAADRIVAGVARVDVTPTEPVWLAGYAARKHAHTGIDTRLFVTAMTLANENSDHPTVIVSLDNCEVTEHFTKPVLREIESRYALPPEAVIILSTHTHSAPVLPDTLPGMFGFEGEEAARIRRYGERLRKQLVEVVGAALAKAAPVKLSVGMGRAGFAMNRRVYRGGKATFGENHDGPTVEDVPVLRVSSLDGKVLAVLFGYACHATTIGGASGDEFYAVSGDYPGYARRAIEEVWPGAQAMFLIGFGADINPAPRGGLQRSRQHGLELAGAVTGVLTQPMRDVGGEVRRATRRVRLPLEPAPPREKLVEDARSENEYIARRARYYLDALDAGKPRPQHVECPITVLRIGDDLTFVFMAGEVVIDYALRLGRELGAERPWLVGYATGVPCYFPSRRILLEGGYEADSSLIYYGLYGPFQESIEDRVVGAVREMVPATRSE